MSLNFISKAILFATDAHKDQTRKHSGKPYIIHPVTVANDVTRFTDNIDIYIAALLHDTVEDVEHVTNEIIVEEFGTTIGYYVECLTDEYTKVKYPHLIRRQRTKLETERAILSPEEVKLIKYCDIKNNVPSIVEHDKDFAKVYLIEKRNYLSKVRTQVYHQAYEEVSLIVKNGIEQLRHEGFYRD